MISELEIKDSVIWVGPASSEDEIANRIRLATLALSVPSSDSASVSVLEAMACGVPVIASDLPAMREIITNGENGLLVPPGNSSALIQAILELILQPVKMRLISDNSLLSISQRSSWDDEMGKVELMYQTLINK
jgi:glycosyltransferase involved in cell wall biosynthesis